VNFVNNKLITIITTTTTTTTSCRRSRSSTRTIIINNGKRVSNSSNSSNSSDSSDEFEEEYIDLDLSENQIHIVEFYAPWCPHCQDFKPEYVMLAREVQRRVIGAQVTFHAVSCTLNENVCLTYEIDSYPSVYGWRLSDDEGKIQLRSFEPENGVGLNFDEENNMNANSIALMMNFDLAEEPLESPSSDSNSEDEVSIEEKKRFRSQEAATSKRAELEFYGSINDLYHDAAVSLLFALKTGYVARKKLDEKRVIVLRDFMSLVEWAAPPWWDVRLFVKDFLIDFDRIIEEKGDYMSFLEQYQVSMIRNDEKVKSELNTRQREFEEDKLGWGYIKRNKPGLKLEKKKVVERMSLGGEPQFYELSKNEIIRQNMRWTGGCTHKNEYSGFSCGLWHIFHILTIGASREENQVYGFHRGYNVSPFEVGATIRNFVKHFFSCEVCRTNFLDMYDNCGHDHCTRLITTLPFISHGMTEGKSSKEAALWLWEVHNAVNIRLIGERAERDKRELSKAEKLAAKFPGKAMCQTCWLDDDMEKWDQEEVFLFLKDWYWPVIDESDLRLLSLDSDFFVKGNFVSMSGIFLILLPLALSVTFGKEIFVNRWTLSRSYKYEKNH